VVCDAGKQIRLCPALCKLSVILLFLFDLLVEQVDADDVAADCRLVILLVE
jgi:hypothetical protein